MKTSITIYHNLRQEVSFLYTKLNLKSFELSKGRKLLIPIVDILTLGLFRATQNIATKKSLAGIFNLTRSYKTLVVNLNRFSVLIALVLNVLIQSNRQGAHPIKHTDSTDIPVCLNKNGKHHKTMRGLAEWGRTGKGWFYGSLRLLSASSFTYRAICIGKCLPSSSPRATERTARCSSPSIVNLWVSSSPMLATQARSWPASSTLRRSAGS